ncbi:hypothetical protein M5D96_003786 [Drosophila gunungcola]|uniref:Uncharacterized protein n=1 Tax=Drosophila gunungcola TaxID=103775 RepID=A0A9P9YTH8_9MUSC|nr:hypothetical protein M5D96_003786 [Drosophila gunungcola]
MQRQLQEQEQQQKEMVDGGGGNSLLNALQDVCPHRMSSQQQKRKERNHCACN